MQILIPFKSFFLLFLLFTIVGCESSPSEKSQLKDSVFNQEQTFKITELDDKQYPDNPDIGFRAKDYNTKYLQLGKISPTKKPFHWDISFYTKHSDSIQLFNLDLSEFLPTLPESVRSNDYMCYIACINQEWNRNQVKFEKSQFISSDKKIIRVDIARNCLNTFLWEVILYINEDGKTVPYAHGWFDFPHELYTKLFEKKNKVSFDDYKKGMVNWVDPASKKVDLNLLRKVVDTLDIQYFNASNKMYPVAGERLRKYREIIYPTSFKTMQDLQNDSTLFATFTPPGFYNRADPRKTELGRFYYLTSAVVYRTFSKSQKDTLLEVSLTFRHRLNGQKTQLVIGGLNTKEFPVLSEKEANNGWKTSMGIGNHTFYESYDEHLENKTKSSSYFGVLLDGKGNWLDSHKVGIDGPLFHFSDKERKNLHLWLLSFERHALVGHYLLNLN